MVFKGKKVMVVGGAGFIGSHLADALAQEGAYVVIVDDLSLGKRENVRNFRLLEVDATKRGELIAAFENFTPDLVYNLAVRPLPHCLKEPEVNVDDNIRITLNLLALLRWGWYDRLIHFSSSEVYGSAQYAPMCEKHPLEASTPYAASKASCDMICMSYYRTFGSRVAIIRPFNNYGPRQNKGSYAGVIPLTIQRCLDNQPLLLNAPGTQTRDYIYVEDTARAAVLLGMQEDLNGEVFNIGSGHDVSIDWLLKEIRFLMKKPKLEIRMKEERAGDVHRHIANCLKAKDVLGFEHTTSMAEGLQKTIQWYRDQEG